MQNRFVVYGMIAYTFICVVVGYFYINIEDYENKIRTTLLSQSIDGTDAASDNLMDKIIRDDFVKENIIDIDLRKENEKFLKEFENNRNISSVYLLVPYDEHFFILLDSANDGSQSEEIQPFILGDIDTNSLIKAQKSKKKQIYIQEEKNTNNLGFTLIKPIVQDGELVAFLVIDYSQKTYDSLTSLLKAGVKNTMISLGVGLLFLTLFIGYFIKNEYVKNRRYKNPNSGSFYRSYLTDHYEKINFSNYYIALIDIDFFKRINDLYGQANGDKVINSVMKKISLLLYKEDIFIQYGGEEFLLLVSKQGVDIQTFRYRMEDIRIMVEKLHIIIENETINMTISIGALTQTEVASSLQDAIHKADAALYESKHNGRNSVHYFDISDEKRLYREKLKEMIESDKLVCFYQPIVSLYDGKTYHYEALLRLEDGDKIIYPDKILPDLENSYFYSRISMRVIEYNVKKLREKSDFKVSINLSSDDLLNDAIIALLVKNADIANRMLIEILETKDVDYLKVEMVIQKLKLLGYQLCIDDYGSGYSNLNHLLNLSIDYLKIDGSIIRNIHVDKKAHSLIHALTRFCQQNEIKVVAEFVENSEIVEVLKGLGIEYGQGYYFDRAKPYDELGL